MASFDIKLLLATIPLQEMIDLFVQKLFGDNNYNDRFSKDYFHEMLTVTMTEYFTLFENKYYRQSDRVAMGSPHEDPLWLISFYVYTKLFGLKNAHLSLNQSFIKIMLTTLSCFFKTSNWKIQILS